MQTSRTTEHSCQRVAHRQVVVVVCVEVEVTIGVAFHHLTHVLHTLQWVHNAERVRQQETLYACMGQRVHHLVDIIDGVAHARTPVLEIKIHVKPLLLRIFK